MRYDSETRFRRSSSSKFFRRSSSSCAFSAPTSSFAVLPIEKEAAVVLYLMMAVEVYLKLPRVVLS